MEMKPIRMIVVESTTRPGELSIRAKKGDATATPIFRALNASGAKIGDVLELRLVPPVTLTEGTPAEMKEGG